MSSCSQSSRLSLAIQTKCMIKMLLLQVSCKVGKPIQGSGVEVKVQFIYPTGKVTQLTFAALLWLGSVEKPPYVNHHKKNILRNYHLTLTVALSMALDYIDEKTGNWGSGLQVIIRCLSTMSVM